MKLIFTLVAVIASLFCGANTALAMNDAEAINISGGQRMLSQRMMKSYLMIGAEIKADAAQKQLDESAGNFEESLGALIDYAPTDNIKTRLNNVKHIWNQHRMRLLSAPRRDNIEAFMQENRELLNACNDVVIAIADYASVPAAELVNIAGRQRMLSQQIAKAYIAMSWHVDTNIARKEFDDSISLFDESLKKLELSPLNTDEVKNTLERVRSQWSFSKSGFRLKDDDRYVPTVITVTMESILWKMNDITRLYEQIMSGKELAGL